MFKPHEYPDRVRRRAFLGAVAASGVGIAAVVATSKQEAGLDVELTDIAKAETGSHHRVDTITMDMINNEDHPIEPAFNMVHEGLPTRFYWNVQHGTDRLLPGEQESFRISPPIPQASIPYDSSAMLSVNDSGTGVEKKWKISTGEKEPPPVLNAELTDWVKDPGGPLHPFRWVETFSPPAEETAVVEESEGGAEVSVEGTEQSEGPWAMAGLIQTIELPHVLRVRATPRATLPSAGRYPSAATGIELAESNHRMWIVFADVNERVVLYRGGELSYIMVFVPASLGGETSAKINPRKLYREYGWRLPGKSERVVDGNRYISRHCDLLAFAATYPGTDYEKMEAEFHYIGSR